jgi:general secretion pathway protein L
MASLSLGTGLRPGVLWRWWLDELRGLLPARPARAALVPRAVIALYERTSLRLAIRRGQRLDKLGSIRLPDPGRPELGAVDPAAGPILARVRRSRLPVVLRLPAAMGLVCPDVLPASAERELASIMANRIDLLTPWSAEQVHADQRIDRRDDGQLAVSLVVAPRAAVAEARRRLAALGLEPRVVDLVEDDPWALPTVDLAHGLVQSRRGSRWLGIAALVLLVPVLVAGLGLGQQILARKALIAERQQQVDALEQRLADLPELRANLEALRSEMRFVAERQREAPSPLIVLEALSELLPDSVWLSDLTIEGGTVTINGFAEDAAAVLGLVEGSPYFAGAEFRAPSTRERVPLADGSEREVNRFSVAARIESLRSLDP